MINTINKDIIDFLLNAHKPGIVAFINEVDKKVLVIYRKSVIDGITAFIKECNKGSYKYKVLEKDYILDKITINILETFDSITDQDLKLQHTKYVNLYPDYKHYNKRKALSLRLRKYIDYKGVIHVQLVNRANKKITVGIFRNLEHCDKFISSNYPDLNNIYKVVYDSSFDSKRMWYKEEYE